MFDGFIQKEIDALDTKLRTIDPHTQGTEYEQLLRLRELLVKQVGMERDISVKPRLRDKLDPNVIIKALGTLAIVGGIMVYESRGNIFTGKATSFIPKLL